MIKVHAATRLVASRLIRLADIKVSDQKTRSDCYDMIDMIKQDPRNVVGGYSAWASGKHTELTPAAKKKVELLEKRAWSLEDNEEDEDD